MAKELGVTSKAILDKCRAEGLEELKNHMAVLSAGLEATIREWFSEGSHDTAEEKADRVDLKSVRKRAPRKRVAKKVIAEPPPVVAETPTTAVAEGPPPPVEVVPIAAEISPALAGLPPGRVSYTHLTLPTIYSV